MKLCATIIPTIGRPALERALESAIAQEIAPDLHEIIIVNDSGRKLDLLNGFSHPKVTIIESNQGGPCVARNMGASMANSQFLHFLDDDDYLMPGGLNELISVARNSKAVWIYGAMHCVDNNGNLVFDNQPQVLGNLFSIFVCGETLSLIPSIIDRQAFIRVGGFDLDIIPSEERFLACRLALTGSFDRTDKFVATARVGVGGSSIDYGAMKKTSRLVREKAFDLTNASDRLKDSVKGDAHLRGRVCRAYIISFMLNLIEGRILIAARRCSSFLSLSFSHFHHRDFWTGIFYDLNNREFT